MKHSKKRTNNAGKTRNATKPVKAARYPRAAKPRERDPRLPVAGTILKREFKSMTFRVHVLEDGFGCNGEEWRSLSALASKITGNSTNGFLWFGLTRLPPSHEPPESSIRSGGEDSGVMRSTRIRDPSLWQDPVPRGSGR